MDEQEKFNQWWESKGVNSVILRAQAWSAWLARAEAEQQTQPAEDPDEWVIQDKVPVRSDVDKCWCINPLEPLPADPEFMWSIHSNGFFSSKMHGDETRYGTVHVMCRRRDLPSNADWFYHNQQKPQPKKTMLRLWIDPDCNIHAGIKGDRDLELLYDHETRQFYTEEPS